MKPCPFCGGRAEMIVMPPGSEFNCMETYRVSCMACRVSTQRTSTRELTEQFWNCRAESADAAPSDKPSPEYPYYITYTDRWGYTESYRVDGPTRVVVFGASPSVRDSLPAKYERVSIDKAAEAFARVITDGDVARIWYCAEVRRTGPRTWAHVITYSCDNVATAGPFDSHEKALHALAREILQNALPA